MQKLPAEPKWTRKLRPASPGRLKLVVSGRVVHQLGDSGGGGAINHSDGYMRSPTSGQKPTEVFCRTTALAGSESKGGCSSRRRGSTDFAGWTGPEEITWDFRALGGKSRSSRQDPSYAKNTCKKGPQEGSKGFQETVEPNQACAGYIWELLVRHASFHRGQDRKRQTAPHRRRRRHASSTWRTREVLQP